MTRLADVLVYPVKGLDPERVDAATLDETGLARDERYVLVTENDNEVDSARARSIHRLRSSFDFEARTLTLREHGTDESETFDLAGDRSRLSAWLTEFFGFDVSLRRATDAEATGPTVVARSSFEAAAEWIDGVDADGMRRRFRPNLVVADAPAFWEDRLFAGEDEVVAFDVGDVTLEGLGPRGFQMGPNRDPDTGERTRGFQRPFVVSRRDNVPEWADRSRFDHYFELTTRTRVPAASRDAELAVGDEVSVGDVRER